MGERQELQVWVGTDAGLVEVGSAATTTHLDGRAVTGLARAGTAWWTLVDRRALWCRSDDGWSEVARTDGPELTCLCPTAAAVWVGTAGARLLRLDGSRLVPVPAFDATPGRETWYTPWGGPPDTRSLGAGAGGALFANVHVGGIVRSTDGGRSFEPTVDIEADVHQVLADPRRAGRVLAAAAVGLGVSEDGGTTWRFEVAGLHARYARAVAVAEDVVVLSVSTGPGGRRAAVYRHPLTAGAVFERCRAGLPEWLGDNVDTGCLVAAGPVVALGAADGRVFVSTDRGTHWAERARGLPPIRCLALA